ncbi:hypothetical protein BDV18DRAFT_149382 [Aspergillus unguis]
MRVVMRSMPLGDGAAETYAMNCWKTDGEVFGAVYIVAVIHSECWRESMKHQRLYQENGRHFDSEILSWPSRREKLTVFEVLDISTWVKNRRIEAYSDRSAYGEHYQPFESDMGRRACEVRTNLNHLLCCIQRFISDILFLMQRLAHTCCWAFRAAIV